MSIALPHLAEEAERLGLPYRDVGEERPEEAALQALPLGEAARLNVLPLALQDGVLRVATAAPDDLALEQRLGLMTGAEIDLVVSSPEAIERALRRCDGAGKVMEDVGEAFSATLLRESETGRVETVDLDAVDEASAPVVRLVNSILSAALSKQASDIHIHARADGVMVDFRIDGVLTRALGPFASEHHAPLVSRIKVMSELDIAESRVPQDGRFKLRLRRADIDFRVSVLPGVFGEDVVIRILDKSHLMAGEEALSLRTLGFEASEAARLEQAVRAPTGMILVTGPTGSGKTTSLYACLHAMDASREKIITIEDPVEYELPAILQIPVNDKKGLTFAKGLRAILRHDPDKVMVGEIRDRETAAIAVQAALTGHLVLSTLHANSSVDVVARFTHMGLDLYELVSALSTIIAQRLVRRLCDECARPAPPTQDEAARLGLEMADRLKGRWRGPVGCETCGGTGYRGRAVVAETLELDDGLREMILARRPAQELRDRARENGMLTVREAALAKARAGITSLAEVERVT